MTAGIASTRRDGFDLLVIGAGVFGTGTGLEAARRGLTVAVIDGSPLPNPAAASTGPSRKVRSTYLDVAYVRLVHQAMDEWTRVERDTDQSFFERRGNLVYTTADRHPTLDALETSVTEAGGTIERLDRSALRERFPWFKPANLGMFEPAGGLIHATQATGALATLARRAGATMLTGVAVDRLELDGPDPEVVLADGRRLSAPRIVVAAGAWSTRLIPELRSIITLKQQGLAYLPDLPASFDAEGLPPFSELETIFYGFPRVGSDPVKIGWHAYGEVIDDPDTDRDRASVPFLEGVELFLREHLGLDVPVAAMRGASCLYDLTPTTDFIIDFLPGQPAVLVATGGSGHGFKFGSIIGRITMDRLDGTTGSWLPQFAWPTATD